MTTPSSLDARISSLDPNPASGEHPPLLQPLHRIPQTWKVIWGWTLWYGSASWITAKPMRIRDVRAATAVANGMGSQYTLSPVKLCSVSQMPSQEASALKQGLDSD